MSVMARTFRETLMPNNGFQRTSSRCALVPPLNPGVRRPKARGKETTYRHQVYQMTGECERRGKRESVAL